MPGAQVLPGPAGEGSGEKPLLLSAGEAQLRPREGRWEFLR